MIVCHAKDLAKQNKCITVGVDDTNILLFLVYHVENKMGDMHSCSDLLICLFICFISYLNTQKTCKTNRRSNFVIYLREYSLFYLMKNPQRNFGFLNTLNTFAA